MSGHRRSAPLEDAVEHGGNRTRYAHLIQAYYRTEYEAIFQSLPGLANLPQDAGPGGASAEKAAWNGMDASARQDASRVFANMGKVIAAYEKTLAHGESRFDHYAEGVVNGNSGAEQALTPKEVRGLRIFIGKGPCVTCHNGPLFTDQHFHNTGVPQRDPSKPDHGRAAALAKVRADEFNCLGTFSDAKAEQCQELQFMVAEDATLEGAFKTPSLRGVSLRAPYMHAGQFASIEEVIAHYMKAPAATVGHTERKPIRLSEQEAMELISFLGTLSGPIVQDSKR